jgi:hypothetical protein
MTGIAPEQPPEDGGLVEEAEEVEPAADLDEERLAAEGDDVVDE